MSDNIPGPPEYLCEVAADFWRTVARDYHLSDWQFFVLRSACDAKHREEQAQAVLDRDGLTYPTGKGMVRQRPEVVILRDSRTAFLRACRDLCLEVGE